MSGIDPHVFVIFGGTGDLARRKLIPALVRALRARDALGRCVLLGVATRERSDESYREAVTEALSAAGMADTATREWVARAVHYQAVRGEDGYRELGRRLLDLEAGTPTGGNRVFYLALPPAVFPAAIGGLGEAGLAHGPGWTRLVVEKPFGSDLASAEALNTVIHRFFDERDVYRIDHYLGKETVQNLLAFRFANPVFEGSWNRDRVEAVDITVAETLGIEARAGYYEAAGVVRDMVQNHLTQLLALVAMEPPVAFDAERIRNEKVKVVEAIAPIDLRNVAVGRYEAGRIDGTPVPGYREEPGVAPDSTTPTFVSLTLGVDTWRWHGVPFRLRTGKRLPRRVTTITVTFRKAPLCFFHGERDACLVEPNRLVLELQPDEGFALSFNVKRPGTALAVDRRELDFAYAEAYHRLPDAYETLVVDVIEGDQTLFVRADEVEASWRVYTPLLEVLPAPTPYPAGTWPFGGEPALTPVHP